MSKSLARILYVYTNTLERVFMKNLLVLTLISVFFSLPAFSAGEDFAVKMQNSGFVSLLESALDSYANEKDATEIVLPYGRVNERVEKEFFDTNPIIQKIKEYVILDLSQDLRFYVKWSPIKVRANVMRDRIKVMVEGENKRDLTLAIKFSIDRLSVFGRYIELCEIRKGVKKCDSKNSLYGKFEGYHVSLNRGERIDAVALFKLKVNNDKASIKFHKAYTNLIRPRTRTERAMYEKYGITTNRPGVYITFKNFIMPPPVLTINGESFEIDVERIKAAILEEKVFLGRQMVKFAGEFFTGGFADTINKSVFDKIKEFRTSINVIDYTDPSRVNNIRDIDYSLFQPRYETAVADNTRVAVNPRVEYLQDFYSNAEEPELMEQLMSMMKSLIYQARFNLEYLAIRTPESQDVEVGFDSTLTLNNREWSVGTKIHNGKKSLGKVSFDLVETGYFNKPELKDYDIAVAISEPVVNAGLKMGRDHDIFQNLIDRFAPMPGVYIEGLNIHFVEKESTWAQAHHYVDVVANVRVKFSELAYEDGANWWQRRMQDIENGIASALEGGSAYFPLEIRFSPVIKEKDGKQLIILEAQSPLNKFSGFKNTYGYPYKDMKGIVEKGIRSAVADELLPHLDKLPEIDITPYLQFPGVRLTPVGIYVKKSGYLVITTKIDELDLQQLRESKFK
jgi:hypothetical protein